MTKFVIRTSTGFVYSMRHPNGITTTQIRAVAKRFTTKQRAQAFIDRYSDCGYGLNSDDANIYEEVA